MLKKTVAIFIFTMFCLGICHCSGNKVGVSPDREYETIGKEFNSRLKLVRSGNEQAGLIDKKNKQLRKLLKRLSTYPSGDNLELLRGTICSDLKLFDSALDIFEILIQKKSAIAPAAKFQKARIFLELKKYELAGETFQDIEKEINRDEKYFQAIFQLAIHLRELEKRWIYSHQFLNAAREKEYLHNQVGAMYTNLADIERERFDKKKAIQLLQNALRQPLNPDVKRTISGHLKPLRLIDSPAPLIKAFAWLNSEPLNLKMPGERILVIDFWSPGCSPCREMFPRLTDIYLRNKQSGLQVIGIALLTRRYSDDIYYKRPVTREKYIKLIRFFLKRHQVNFPVALVGENQILDDFGVIGFPTLFLLDRNGKIRDFKLGSDNFEAFEQKIKNLISEK